MTATRDRVLTGRWRGGQPQPKTLQTQPGEQEIMPAACSVFPLPSGDLVEAGERGSERV